MPASRTTLSMRAAAAAQTQRRARFGRAEGGRGWWESREVMSISGEDDVWVWEWEVDERRWRAGVSSQSLSRSEGSAARARKALAFAAKEAMDERRVATISTERKLIGRRKRSYSEGKGRGRARQDEARSAGHLREGKIREYGTVSGNRTLRCPTLASIQLQRV